MTSIKRPKKVKFVNIFHKKTQSTDSWPPLLSHEADLQRFKSPSAVHSVPHCSDRRGISTSHPSRLCRSWRPECCVWASCDGPTQILFLINEELKQGLAIRRRLENKRSGWRRNNKKDTKEKVDVFHLTFGFLCF